MYEGACKVSEPMPQPVATLLIEEAAGINNWQREYISIIENKLHNLLNLRVPQPEKTNEPKPMIEDFISAMRDKQRESTELGKRLEKIAEHLGHLV